MFLDFLKSLTPKETVDAQDVSFEEFKKLLKEKTESNSKLIDLTDMEIEKVFEKAKHFGNNKLSLEEFIDKIVYSDYCGYCGKMTPFTVSSEKRGVAKSCLLCEDTSFDDLDNNCSYFTEIPEDLDIWTEDEPFNKRAQEVIEPISNEKEIGKDFVLI